MQIDQKTLVQTGFKKWSYGKVGLTIYETKESLATDSQPSVSGKLDGRWRNSET